MRRIQRSERHVRFELHDLRRNCVLLERNVNGLSDDYYILGPPLYNLRLLATSWTASPSVGLVGVVITIQQ